MGILFYFYRNENACWSLHQSKSDQFSSYSLTVLCIKKQKKKKKGNIQRTWPQRSLCWLQGCLPSVYNSSGLEHPEKLRAHSTKGISSSTALHGGITVEDNGTAASWSSPCSFIRFYLHNVCAFSKTHSVFRVLTEWSLSSPGQPPPTSSGKVYSVGDFYYYLCWSYSLCDQRWRRNRNKQAWLCCSIMHGSAAVSFGFLAPWGLFTCSIHC